MNIPPFVSSFSSRPSSAASSDQTPAADKSQGKQAGLSAPTKITPDTPFSGKGIEIDLSVQKENISFEQPREERISIQTGDGADKVHIKNSSGGGIRAEINGKAYEVPLSRDGKSRHFLDIQTGGGNDNVSIADDVLLPVSVKLGEGNDTFKAGGGRTNVYGGAGNDTINLRGGIGYAEGNAGDDSIIGGSGYSVMYGGNGNDKLRGGAGGSYMDGGDGNDSLRGGRGHSIMNGGKGDDILRGGEGKNTIYSGKGQDTINSTSHFDTLYTKESDYITGATSAERVKVTPRDAGREAFSVEGDDEFKQRVEDDLELLRSSPSGQKLLGALDKTPAPITIREQPEGESAFYNYGRKGLAVDDHRVEPPNDSAHGYIENNKAGASADDAEILYGRSFVVGQHKRPPIIPVVHEMGHAYNGVNGTSLPGETYIGPDKLHPDKPQFEPNRELQAIGLPTTAQAYDLDNDPSTPPTNTNPSWATENGLAEELRIPKRDRYLS